MIHTVAGQEFLTRHSADDDLRHIMRRAGFGYSVYDLQAARAGGWKTWLESQLAPEKLPDPGGDAVTAACPLSVRTIAETWAQDKLPDGKKPHRWDGMHQLGHRTMGMQCYSSRQLFEQMVDFWSNHFNVTYPSGRVWDCRTDYDVHVIRKHALGKFSDMLIAASFHPAMLKYLDSFRSTAKSPNENFARELMELHTIGVKNVAEEDVMNTARLLTGWVVNDKKTQGQAVFEPKRHDPRAVAVLGHEVPRHEPAQGPDAQYAFIAWLAKRPETAKHLCRKLCIKFVSDDPPESLVTKLTAVWTKTDGQIIPVLRALFYSKEFWASYGQKVRKPNEDVAATVRALALPAPQASAVKGRKPYGDLYHLLALAGHLPGRWAAPDGYSELAKDWQTSGVQLHLWNVHHHLVGGGWPKSIGLPDGKDRSPVRPESKDPKKPLPQQVGPIMDMSPPQTYGELIEYAVQMTGIGVFPTSHRLALVAMRRKKLGDLLDEHEPWKYWAFPELLAQIFNSPAFKVR